MLIAVLQAVASGLAVGGAYALIALGFSITFTTTKTLNFSHGDFVSVGSFIGVTVLWLLLGMPINAPLAGVAIPMWQQLLAAVVTVTVVGLIGVALYFLAVKPFAGKPGMSWVMTTIGFGILLTSVGLAVWGPSQLVVPSPVGDDTIRIAGVGIRPQEILMFVVAIVVMAVLDGVMHRTIMGKAMRAVAHDQRVASLMGINVTAVMVGAFFLSSALAGLSGFLIAPIASASLYVGLSIASRDSPAPSSAACLIRAAVFWAASPSAFSSLSSISGRRSGAKSWCSCWSSWSSPSGLMGYSASALWRKSDALPSPPRGCRDRGQRRSFGGRYRQRLLSAHRFHDVRLLSLRRRHERSRRLRWAEISRTSGLVCRRRLRCSPVVDQL
jgi:branched-chain amino acid transport system permease protein